MKKLFLIRHAKSSWAFDLHDHDRPLGKRGRKDVIKMAKHLTDKISPPEVFISSTASRALYTALHICDAFGLDEGHIRLTKDLFHASAREILNVIREAPSCSSLAIFGHNPGFTSAANSLANVSIDNVPTCGIVAISFETNSWSDIEFGSGRMDFFDFPKRI